MPVGPVAPTVRLCCAYQPRTGADAEGGIGQNTQEEIDISYKQSE